MGKHKRKRRKQKMQNETTVFQKFLSVFFAALLYLFALGMIIYVYPKIQSDYLFENPDVFYYCSDVYAAFCTFSVVSTALIFAAMLMVLFYSGAKSTAAAYADTKSKNKKRISTKKKTALIVLSLISIFIAAAPLLVVKNRFEITSEGVCHYNKYNNVTEAHMYSDLNRVKVEIKTLSGYRTHTRYTIAYILEFRDGYTIETYLDGTGNGKYKDRALGMLHLDRVVTQYAPKIVGSLENIEKLKESRINMSYIMQILNS